MKSEEMFQGIDILEYDPGKGLLASQEVIETIQEYFRDAEQSEGYVVFNLTAGGEFLSVTIEPGAYIPEILVKDAVMAGSYGIVTMLNKGSAGPEPGPEDKDRVKKLKDLCWNAGIAFIDEVLLGDDRHVSLKERKAIL